MTPRVRLRRHDDAETFLGAAAEFLASRAFEHELLYGIAGQLQADPELYASVWYGTLERDEEVVAAMLRTPPHPLVISHVPSEFIDPLVGELVVGDPEVSGVQGLAPSAEELARALGARLGREVRIGMRQRFHVLREVRSVRPGPGHMRVGTESDVDLLTRWSAAMMTEAGSIEPADLERATRHRVAQGRLVLWEVDGRPVAMAASAREFVGGAGVNLVYTPPELRGRGYATRLVAALSQSLLDAGHPACFLYTDLANPTSNSIYRAIGYEPAFDPVQVHLVSDGETPSDS